MPNMELVGMVGFIKYFQRALPVKKLSNPGCYRLGLMFSIFLMQRECKNFPLGR